MFLRKLNKYFCQKQCPKGIKRESCFCGRVEAATKDNLEKSFVFAKIGSSKLVKVSQNLTDKKSPKRAIIYICSNFGWDGRIRTCECWDQNPVPYHLATSHYCQDNDDYSTPDRKNPHILI